MDGLSAPSDSRIGCGWARLQRSGRRHRIPTQRGPVRRTPPCYAAPAARLRRWALPRRKRCAGLRGHRSAYPRHGTHRARSVRPVANLVGAEAEPPRGVGRSLAVGGDRDSRCPAALWSQIPFAPAVHVARTSLVARRGNFFAKLLSIALRFAATERSLAGRS